MEPQISNTLQVAEKKVFFTKLKYFINDQFSWEFLGIQILFGFYLTLIPGILGLGWKDIYSQIINHALGFIAFLAIIRIILISPSKFIHARIKRKISIKDFSIEEKACYSLSFSGLIQMILGGHIINALFYGIDITTINPGTLERDIKILLFLIMIFQGGLNILLGFYSIKSKPYRTNYFIGPIIILLIVIGYLLYI